MIQVAIMGYGTVGSGVAEVIHTNREGIKRELKEDMEVKYILDLRDFPGDPEEKKIVHDFDIIVNDPEIDIVVETMGGVHPAYEFSKRALEAGKSVCTSNKELVAAKGAELLAIAQRNNLNFLFEASVGGGIPIIRPISQCLAANEVSEIAGILNGTTNFILTKMIREHMGFEEALELAQQLGYAERDPAADVEGDDACRKICILASLAFGTHVYPRDVHTEGITHVTLGDVGYAEAWGGVIKLIGEVRTLENGKIQIEVCPMFVSRESQLSSVDDVFNGIMVRGDATGDVVFYGKGAGKLPTASAVVADVIDCVKHFKARKYLFWEDAKPGYVEPYENMVEEVFIRAKGNDSDAAFEVVEQVFEGAERLIRREEEEGEIGFTVKDVKVKELETRFARLKELGVESLNHIKISDF